MNTQVYKGQGDQADHGFEINEEIQPLNPRDDPDEEEFWIHNPHLNLMDAIQAIQNPSVANESQSEEDDQDDITEENLADSVTSIPDLFAYRDHPSTASSADSSTYNSIDEDDSSNAGLPSTIRQRRPRRTSEVLEDFSVLNIDDNATDDSVFVTPGQTVRLPQKKKRRITFDSGGAMIPLPISSKESAPGPISGCHDPRRSVRLSSISSASSEDLEDLQLVLEDTIYPDPEDQPLILTSTPKSGKKKSFKNIFKKAKPTSPQPSTSSAAPKTPVTQTSQVTPSITRSKSAKANKAVDEFQWCVQFVNFKANCWANQCLFGMFHTMKKAGVVIDPPTESVVSKWTHVDYLKSWYNEQAKIIVNPRVFLEKLIDSMYFERESIQWNRKRKMKFLKQHCPSETLPEALQNTEVLKPLRPTAVDVLTYARCICGHQMEEHQNEPFEWALFVLRTIQDDDTINTMLLEEFNKVLMIACESCGQDVRSTTQRKFIDHADGFVASINRATFVPSKRHDQDGNAIMVGVSHNNHFDSLMLSK